MPTTHAQNSARRVHSYIITTPRYELHAFVLACMYHIWHGHSSEIELFRGIASVHCYLYTNECLLSRGLTLVFIILCRSMVAWELSGY